MSFWSVLLLAIGLAMDAMAVAAARGLLLARILPRHLVLVAGFFGAFQAVMPLFGWMIGSWVGPVIQHWDHWIAFSLLGAVGAKMLWDARGTTAPETRHAGDPFALKVMFVLAVATSVDAFAVGITLPLLGAPLILSIATIGITTALLSALGLFAGRYFGAILGKRLDVLGGLVLIGLGVKVLAEHFLFGP